MKLFFKKFLVLRFIIAFLTFSSLFFPSLALAQKQVLPLALPYCFLLPKKNAFALDCARKSVQNIVAQYARCGVHVIPEFRWWGNNHSENPQVLKDQATTACNLNKAFPWATRGAIQVFTADDSIPTEQCKKGPNDLRRAKGCSDLCPAGSPSFSTVSGKDCSADISIHESGHSNCCGSNCHNQGADECNPRWHDAGCNLCLKAKGPIQVFIANQMDYGAGIAIHESDGGAVDAGCQLTSPACESIRQGASKNPDSKYVYDPNEQYEIQGKKRKSIFKRNSTDVRPLVKGVGDPKEDATPNLGVNEPATPLDLEGATPRRPSSKNSNINPASNQQESSDRTTYEKKEMPELVN